MEKSRLSNSLEKKAKQNIILAGIGIVAIIIFLIIFGQKILVGLGLLASTMSRNDTTNSTTAQSGRYIEPPTLNPAIEATNSATTTLSGAANAEQTVSLYNNDDLVDKKTVASDNTFKFTNVTLKDGVNTFKTKVSTKDNKTSDYSNEIIVTRLNKAPKLDVSSPTDGQSYKKAQSPIMVTGDTDQGVKVTVNGFWAIVNDQGHFTYSYNLQSGDNTLKIEATDEAGNKTSKEVKIHVED